MIELTNSDPDPYFFGSYNWYYTGGTLEVMPICGVDFLFYVNGPKLNIFSKYENGAIKMLINVNSRSILDSTHLKSNGHKLEVEHLDSLKIENNNTIHEVITSTDSRYVAARQSNNFAVFYLQDKSSQHNFPCDRKVPFISGAFQEHYFYSIDMNHVLKRYDLRKNKEVGKMYLTAPTGNNYWCQLRRYQDRLLFADPKKLKVYDSRQFGRKESKCMEMKFDNLLEKCEEITCIKADDYENNLYVATTHNLFVFDVRYGSESCNQVARYTHQLKTPPFVIDAIGGGVTGDIANERLAVLTGTFSEDIAIVQHSKMQGTKVRTNSIPQKVLSTMDCYQKLRQNGLQREAEKIISGNRQINIGAKLFRKDSKLFLLTQKASGDIFQQEIRLENDSYTDDDEPLHDYSVLVDRADTKPKYRATTITNFSHLKSILKYRLPRDDESFDMERQRPNKWQQPMTKLLEYKDMLSSDLLNVWHIDTPHLPDDKSAKADLVSGWLSTAADTRANENDDHSMNEE